MLYIYVYMYVERHNCDWFFARKKRCNSSHTTSGSSHTTSGASLVKSKKIRRISSCRSGWIIGTFGFLICIFIHPTLYYSISLFPLSAPCRRLFGARLEETSTAGRGDIHVFDRRCYCCCNKYSPQVFLKFKS